MTAKYATTMPRPRAGNLVADNADLLIMAIQNVETRARVLGMHVTAHALNRAKNAAGYELAGDVLQAGKAARDER